jgi:mRNA-degrading endonuclease RelE of RelBE toxin-antitoxin system
VDLLDEMDVNRPGGSADVRRLTGTNEGRIRVGDWRVRFDRDTAAREIVILRVLRRGRAYDR